MMKIQLILLVLAAAARTASANAGTYGSNLLIANWIEQNQVQVIIQTLF